MILQTTDIINNQKQIIATKIELVNEYNGETLKEVGLRTNDGDLEKEIIDSTSKIVDMIKTAYETGREAQDLTETRVVKDDGIF